jgi:argininosuccinate synthase
MSNKVVLAYSGGLDTTYCAVYLKKIKGLEIHALTVNTGGFSKEEVEQIATRAKSLGVTSFECVDVTKEYYESCIKYLIYGNVLKNATYPLSVSAERMVQAIAVANHVKKTGASYVAHGSTGAATTRYVLTWSSSK